MSGEAPLLATAEGRRLAATARGVGWRRWGPYVSERQWGTVREDYSADGNAWEYISHDHARSRAYRWGEDGLAGFGDERLHWCLGLALWNERDPILKERLFGLTNAEGNHGEDVKEHYCYIDATPTHSYNMMLYRYPHEAFPYETLLAENRSRSAEVPEFEIYDTGIFANNAYFDIIIEYAKADADDILMRVSARNCGRDAAALHILPQLWSRNDWVWSGHKRRARIRGHEAGSLHAVHPAMANMRLDFEAADAVLYCENETNLRRLYGYDVCGPFKDGINDAIVQGNLDAVGGSEGSKAALQRRVMLAPGEMVITRLRLRQANVDAGGAFDDFDEIVSDRIREADEFYAACDAGLGDAELRLIRRRAYAGLLWSKQFYYFDVARWLAGDPALPRPPTSRTRDSGWRHLNASEIVSMPDKWEYPWFAAWDLAFQCIAIAKIDAEFAKAQLTLLTRDWYMHPNGQLPAYEWSFDDVNPPLHAYATWQVYKTDQALTGKPDRAFLTHMFHRLLLNFTWWVNREDRDGRNVFQGGFLGLDNIEMFDRSKPLPTGGTIDQADGTAWMAMYALNMMRIAIELASADPVYEDMASKFFEHFLSIAAAIADIGGGGNGLWDEMDGFFYDVLALPDGRHISLKLRSIVGIIPMFAVEVIDSDVFDRLPQFAARTRWFLNHRPELAALVSYWTVPGKGESRLLSLLRGHRLKCLLRRILDEHEFLSPFGVRSLSRIYATPYLLKFDGLCFSIGYEPAEAKGRLYGGNSNWRGPIWMPINFMLISALRAFHNYYGDDFRVECPWGSGKTLALNEVADHLSTRLLSLFRCNADGRRPFWGDPTSACVGDHDILFHEYFNGETGEGLGASHQTGWTALVVCL